MCPLVGDCEALMADENTASEAVVEPEGGNTAVETSEVPTKETSGGGVLDGASPEVIDLVKSLRDENARRRQDNKHLREELEAASSSEDVAAVKAEFEKRIAEYEAREALYSARREVQVKFPSVPFEVIESLSGATVEDLERQVSAVARLAGPHVAGGVSAPGGGLTPSEKDDGFDVDAILAGMPRSRY